MYPAWELRRLAAHKSALHKRIALRRLACTRAATQVARPLAWLDRVVAFWRRLSPIAKLAAVPLGLLVRRALTPRQGLLGLLLRWGPLAFAAARGLGSVVKSRGEPGLAAGPR